MESVRRRCPASLSRVVELVRCVMMRDHLSLRIGIRKEFAGMIGLLSMLVLAIYLWPMPALRILLGLPYALFLPGYALTTALFPKRSDLDGIVRTALSFGLSIAVLTFVGLLLHYTGLGVRLDPVLISINSCVLLCADVAYYRRSGLCPEDRFVIHLKFDLSSWRDTGWPDRCLSVALTLSIMVAIGSLAYGVARPAAGERFTDFYVLGPDGAAQAYPQDAIVGEPLGLVIGIVNREHIDVQYRVEIERDGDTELVASPRLGHEETWEQIYTFALGNPGDNRQVTFLLYKEDEQRPYRSLHLWITVREESPQA